MLARSERVLAIPGTPSIARLDENAAADVVLSADEMRSIEEAFPNGLAAGTRYDTASMSIVNG